MSPFTQPLLQGRPSSEEEPAESDSSDRSQRGMEIEKANHDVKRARARLSSGVVAGVWRAPFRTDAPSHSVPYLACSPHAAMPLLQTPLRLG